MGVLKVLKRKDLSVASNPKKRIKEHVEECIRKAEDRCGNYDYDKSLILIQVLMCGQSANF